MEKRRSINLFGALRVFIAWIVSTLYVPVMLSVCLCSSKAKRIPRGLAWVRFWGRMMTRILGVRVRFTPAFRKALADRRPRVMTFNHSSSLDVLVGASLIPEGGVLVLKKEFRRIPLLGRAAAMVGSIFLDRGDREKAYASLEAAANRIQTEKLQALIAPEGTRSKDGTMGRFKLGAFHLAHAAQASILPVVMHGNAALWPPGQFAPTRGTVVVDVLPEFRLEDGSPDALRVAANQLRDRYVDALAAGPNE